MYVDNDTLPIGIDGADKQPRDNHESDMCFSVVRHGS